MIEKGDTVSTVRVGLILVGHVPRPSAHVEGDYPELFEALLGPFDVEIVTFDAKAGELPASLDDCDAWLCSPSASSVYDDLPWIAPAEEVLRAIVAEERPYVGMCFGHQLTAQALGGRVEKSDRGWGVGAHRYEISSHPGWIDAERASVTLVASHQDQVVQVPGGTTVWAGNEHCPIGGLTIGERAWTIQLHPEFSAVLSDHLYSGRVETLGAEFVARARESVTTTPLDRELVAHWMARTFRL